MWGRTLSIYCEVNGWFICQWQNGLTALQHREASCSQNSQQGHTVNSNTAVYCSPPFDKWTIIIHTINCSSTWLFNFTYPHPHYSLLPYITYITYIMPHIRVSLFIEARARSNYHIYIHMYLGVTFTWLASRWSSNRDGKQKRYRLERHAMNALQRETKRGKCKRHSHRSTGTGYTPQNNCYRY